MGVRYPGFWGSLNSEALSIILTEQVSTNDLNALLSSLQRPGQPIRRLPPWVPRRRYPLVRASSVLIKWGRPKGKERAKSVSASNIRLN